MSRPALAAVLLALAAGASACFALRPAPPSAGPTGEPCYVISGDAKEPCSDYQL